MRIQLSDHFSYTKLLRYSLPSIIMTVFISLYGIMDGLFVSNFAGKTPFAAISLILPFVFAMGSVGFMVGTGGAAIISKTLGEKQGEKANQIFSMLLVFTVIIGIWRYSICKLYFLRCFYWLLNGMCTNYQLSLWSQKSL